MNKIKSILIVLLFALSLSVFSQHSVRVLQVLKGDDVIDNYILPDQLDSITFNKINIYNISAIPSDYTRGYASVYPSQIEEGQSVTLYASNYTSYRFENWTLNGEIVSTQANYTVTPNSNVQYVANFEHDYVDMGLPSGTKWSICNLGAKSPEEWGNHYSWGETSHKTYFTPNYTYDAQTVIPDSLDAAKINWGSKWNIPTKEDWDELFDSKNTTMKVAEYNGKKVISVTSVKNKNSIIYLPIVGPSTYSLPNETGNENAASYWTSTGSLEETDNAYYAFIHVDNFTVGAITMLNLKYWGMVIRPVIKVNK